MPGLKSAALPVTFAFLLLASFLVLNGGGALEDQLGQMIRITAASSMLLFSLAFSASSLAHLLPNDHWRGVLQARRRLGLSFALSHTVHLIAIISLVEMVHGGDYSQLGDISGGSVIYVFIFAMAATSNDASVKLLGAKNWKRLHKVGAYLIWIGLFTTYLGLATESGAVHYWLFFTLGVALLLVRAWAFWDKRGQT